MDRAWDTETQKYVLAEGFKTATSRKRNRFLCANPNCKKPVFFRKASSGKVRNKVAAFVHYFAESADCDLYIKGISTLGSPPEYIESLSGALNINIRLDQPGKRSSKWWIEIKIPSPLDEIGRVYIDEALFGPRSFSYAELKVFSGASVPLPPKSENYKVRVEGDKYTGFYKRLTPDIQGLSQETITVFKHKGEGGSRIIDNQPLIWGDSYYLVWNVAKEISIPTNMIINELVMNHNWKAVELKLPNLFNAEVYNWIVKHTNHIIEFKNPKVTLVHPYPCRVLDDGSLVISEERELYVGIENIGSKPITLIIKLISKRAHVQKIKIVNDSSPIIKIDPKDAEHIEVYHEGKQKPELRLKREIGIDPIVFPKGPELAFQALGQEMNPKTVIPFHSKATKKYIAQVLARKQELTDLSLPLYFKGKPFQALEQHRRRLVCFLKYPIIRNNTASKAEQHDEYERSVLNELQKFLNGPEQNIIIDFGGYGSITIARTRALMRSTVLPESTKATIHWILSFANSTIAGPDSKRLIDISPHIIQHVKKLESLLKNEEDIRLIGRLDRHVLLPKSIEAHIRELSNGLQSITKKAVGSNT